MNFINKVMKHLLGNIKIRNNPVTQRPNSQNISGGFSNHLLRLGSNRQNLPCFLVDSDNRGFTDNNSLATNKHHCVRRTEINTNIMGEEPKKTIQHLKG